MFCFTALGLGHDVSRDCVPRVEGLEGCITSDLYVKNFLLLEEDLLALIVDQTGAACFCSENLCNAQLSEPEIDGKVFIFLSTNYVVVVCCFCLFCTCLLTSSYWEICFLEILLFLKKNS